MNLLELNEVSDRADCFFVQPIFGRVSCLKFGISICSAEDCKILEELVLYNSWLRQSFGGLSFLDLLSDQNFA